MLHYELTAAQVLPRGCAP